MPVTNKVSTRERDRKERGWMYLSEKREGERKEKKKRVMERENVHERERARQIERYIYQRERWRERG